MSVTRADIERVAALAALDVEEGALAALTKQIGGILEYVEQLKDAPVPDAATSHAAGDACPLREDTVRPDALDRKPKDIAPEFKEGLFLVPPIGRMDDA